MNPSTDPYLKNGLEAIPAIAIVVLPFHPLGRATEFCEFRPPLELNAPIDNTHVQILSGPEVEIFANALRYNDPKLS